MAWVVPVRWLAHAGSAASSSVYIVCKAIFAIALSKTEAPIKDRIYLDHAATSPLRPEARAAMEEGFAIWANPSSPHAEGRKAKQALEDARERVKKALGWDGEVIFTSGASEAAALAMTRSNAHERFVSAVEHDAILAAAPGAPRLVVRTDGAVDCERLKKSLGVARAPLVAIQWINSETGNKLDHGELTDAIHDAGGVVLADCAQSVGKYPLPHDADMVIISAHKFGGPVGVGALLVRDFAMLEPSGGHERGYRRGTENLSGILGMAAALEACETGNEPDDIYDAIQHFASIVRENGGTWLGDTLDAPTGYIHAVAMPNLSGQAQLMRFDLAGFAVSQGSACSSGTLKGSHVLSAMGLPDELADRMIRISTGWNTTADQVNAFAEAWQHLC